MSRSGCGIPADGRRRRHQSTAASASGTASRPSRKSGCWKVTRTRPGGGGRDGRGCGPAAAASPRPVLTMAWRAPARASRAARVRSADSTAAAKRSRKRGSAVSTSRRRPVSRSRSSTGPTRGRSRSRRSRTSMAMISCVRPRPPSALLEAGLEREVGDDHHGAAVARDAARATRWRGSGRCAAGGPRLEGRQAVHGRERRDQAAAVRARRPHQVEVARRGWRPRPAGHRGGASPRRRPPSTSRASSSLVRTSLP